MNLEDIVNHIKTTTTRSNFDAWVSTNIDELTNFFYSLTREELRELRFDTEFYYGVFTQSLVFKEFQSTRHHSEPFDAFLYLLASVAERLAENYGLTSTIDHLLSYLPESSVKYRLTAVAAIQNIDDIRKDYINLFPQVLQWLEKSEAFQEENHSQELRNYLLYYLTKAEGKLKEHNLVSELSALKQLFTKEEFINRYQFLGFVDIQELAGGRFPHLLEVENIPSIILQPSIIIESHFKYNINQPVLEHPKSCGYDILMGFDKMTILNVVLDRGKAKFDEGYLTLTPDDKVLLYCYFNLKKHFFTSLAVFAKLWNSLNNIFSKSTYTPVFIDLGCGPLTSGLALGEIFYAERNELLRFNYIGIDIAEAMIRKAKEFSEIDLFSGECQFSFYKSWNDIDFEELQNLAGVNNPFILNASYLFANLNEEYVIELADFVNKLVTKFKNVHFIYQNPDRADRNVHWESFKGKILVKQAFDDVEIIRYKTSRRALKEPGSERVFYEVLTLKY
ncbi:MAG TPA: class I SAM-dependent methyltransferase [Flavisolibacter sp.]|nr:class I SAM-dependent methyltransferase [Flavisolibacter sp.]